MRRDRWGAAFCLFLAVVAAAGMPAEGAVPQFQTAQTKAHYQKALEYGRRGLWAPAILELNQALRAEPANPDLQIELGIAHGERRQWQPAVAHLRQAVALAPGSARAHYNLALTLDRADPGKGTGIPEYRKTLQLEPEYLDALLNLAIDLGDRTPAESKGLFDRAIRLAPNNAGAHLNFGLLLASESEEGRAVAEFRQAIRLVPGLLEARRQLVALWTSRGQPGEVVEQCREILKRETEDAGTRYTLGQALIRAGNVDEGRKELAQAQTQRRLQQQIKQARGLQTQGIRDLNGGKPADAAKAFTAALQLDPSSDNHMYLGLALAASGDRQSAAHELAAAIERDPRNARAHLNLGTVCLQIGDQRLARREVDKALEIDPWFPEAHNNLALILAGNHQPEQALEHFRLASDLDPQYLEAVFNLGLAYRALHRLADAAATFRRAAALAPQNSQVYYALGATLQDQGDAAGARSALDEAARLERRQK